MPPNKRMFRYIIIIFVVLLFITISTNFQCLQRIKKQYDYGKDNGYTLMLSLIYSLDVWNKKYDYSEAGYDRTINSVLEISDTGMDNKQFYDRIKEAAKKNIIPPINSGNIFNNQIMINQCIIIPKFETVFLTYNTIGLNRNQIIEISLIDEKGYIISSKPGFQSLRYGLLIRNTEDYFWGVDMEKVNELWASVKNRSKDNEITSEYKYLLYDKK